MLNIKFNPNEEEAISAYQESMRYDRLLEILSDDATNLNILNELNDYLISVNELLEFTPAYSLKTKQLKFNQELHLMPVRSFKNELERLTSKYEDYINSESTNHDDQLYLFLTKAAPNLIRNTTKGTVFVDFDGCYGNQLRLDAKPTIGIGESFILNNVIDAIFNHSFEMDKESEWAKVACEYLLREELDAQNEEVEKRLDKLTDFKRHGVDSDNAVKLFLYADMAERKTHPDGGEYWCIYLPDDVRADKAWFNVKGDAVSETLNDKNMIELFLSKDGKNYIHYLKDGKQENKKVTYDKDIIPLLKEISDEYLSWIEGSLNPTFAKKLAVLDVGKDEKDFVIAINDGEYYISIHFAKNEIQGVLYDNNFNHSDAHTIAIEENIDISEIVGKIFERLSPVDVMATLAKCDQETFQTKVAENKKISNYKLIVAIEEMNASDDKQSDLIKAIAKKVS